MDLKSSYYFNCVLLEKFVSLNLEILCLFERIWKFCAWLGVSLCM